MTQHKDPFSMIEAAVWHVLESHRELAAMVSLRNRRRFDGLREPQSEGPELGDSSAPDLNPALFVVAAGGSLAGEGDSSSTCSFRQKFTIGVATDTLRNDTVNRPSAARLKFEIWRAFLKYRNTLPGLSFVRRVRAADFDDIVNNRGSMGEVFDPREMGWIGVIQLEVLAIFDTRELTS